MSTGAAAFALATKTPHVAQARSAGLADEILRARKPVAPPPAPAASPASGPSEDEQFAFTFFRAAGPLRVRDRARFARDIAAAAFYASVEDCGPEPGARTGRGVEPGVRVGRGP